MKLLSLLGALLFINFVVIGEAARSECILTWTKFSNTQVQGLDQQDGVTSEEDCKKACVNNDGCWNVDWNFDENSCWHGTERNPTERHDDPNVNHYDLNCEVKTTTAAPPPTLAPTTPAPPPTLPPRTGSDCTEIRRKYSDATNGVYSLTIPGQSSPVSAYCEMDKAGTGWTVVQRRKNGAVDFQRKWVEYANGFGDLTGEFWWGNDYLAALTSQREYKLRVELINWAGAYTYAEYNGFHVAGAADKYRLTFNNCSYFGNAGNALGGKSPAGNVNGMQFSTIDQDNDNNAGSCAAIFHGAWWYNNCHSANLNGEYNNTKSGQGINWLDPVYSYKVTEMDLRSA